MKKNLTINQIRIEKTRLEKALLDGIYGEISKFEAATGENVKGVYVKFESMKETKCWDDKKQDYEKTERVDILTSVSADLGPI